MAALAQLPLFDLAEDRPETRPVAQELPLRGAARLSTSRNWSGTTASPMAVATARRRRGCLWKKIAWSGAW